MTQTRKASRTTTHLKDMVINYTPRALQETFFFFEPLKFLNLKPEFEGLARFLISWEFHWKLTRKIHEKILWKLLKNILRTIFWNILGKILREIV